MRLARDICRGLILLPILLIGDILIGDILIGDIAPVRAFTLDEIRLHTGTVLELGDIDGGGVSLAFTPESVPALFAHLGEDFHWELSLTSWPNVGVDGDSVHIFHYGPTWRYRPAILPSRSFIEFGTSFAWVSRQRLAGRDLGSNAHFTTHLSAGWRPRADADWHLGLRLRHTSNAGRRSPNPGLDIIMFELGFVP